MRFFKLCATVALASQLSGCWFVFIPGALIAKASDAVTGDKGEHCAPEGVKVGDRFGSQTVVSVSGKSSRCSDATPIRVEAK